MHMVIRCLTNADTEEEALENAKSVFEDLVTRGTFDYYVTFDEDNPYSGKGRWGDLPAAVSADSPEGERLIREAMTAQWHCFLEYLNEVKNMIHDFDPTSLYEEQHPQQPKPLNQQAFNDFFHKYGIGSIRFSANSLGQYEGSNVWLYSQEGSGIRNNKELKWALEPDKEGKPLWVVPADVHY